MGNYRHQASAAAWFELQLVVGFVATPACKAQKRCKQDGATGIVFEDVHCHAR